MVNYNILGPDDPESIVFPPNERLHNKFSNYDDLLFICTFPLHLNPNDNPILYPTIILKYRKIKVKKIIKTLSSQVYAEFAILLKAFQ